MTDFHNSIARYYVMIAACPVEIATKVSGENIPVVGSDIYLYKNADCTKCNNAVEKKYFTEVYAIKVTQTAKINSFGLLGSLRIFFLEEIKDKDKVKTRTLDKHCALPHFRD